MNEEHRGATPNYFYKQQPNTQPLQLDLALNSLEAFFANSIKTASDPQSTLQLLQCSPGKSELVSGTIIQALPHLGWYRVQLGNLQGVMRCCLISIGSNLPFGVRDATVLPAGSSVIVYIPRNNLYGFILGSSPIVSEFTNIKDFNNGKRNPDFIVQGGMTGLLQQPIQRYPLENMYKNGDAINFSSNRPKDATSQEKTFATTTGLLFSLDDYLFQLRVNEMCGVWGSLIDGFLRVAGQQLLIESPVHEIDSGNDEGESKHFSGTATYPWEALGIEKPGTPIGKDYGNESDPAVNFKKQDDPAVGKWPYAAFDENETPSSPFYRYREYGGYLGQGHVREVVVPTFADKNTAESLPAEGVFSEWIGLDGSFHLLSAKSVLIGRRVNIPVAERVKPAEDGTGDDSRADNYKFSGLFGNGEDHKIGDVAVPDDNASIRRVMGVDDLIAYAINWKRVHPFYYHKNDFRVREEAEGFVFNTAQEQLDFSQLSYQNTMSSVFPRTLKIDHRYNQVAYYQTTSFLYFLEDGGVMLADGFGSAIKMTGGKIRLECAGDIELAPGRSLIGIGSQVIMRAKKSVDISASDNDVRIKAERNLHMLAGNSGQGGVLVECKGGSFGQDFKDKIGEEVTSSGIVLKSLTTGIAAIGTTVYIRSVENSIDLDAAKGTQRINLYGKQISTFGEDGLVVWVGPVNEDSTVQRVFYFEGSNIVLPGNVAIGGNVVLYGDNSTIYATGGIFAKNGIATLKYFAQAKSGMVGEVPEELGGAIDDVIDSARSIIEDLIEVGKQLHENDIVAKHYSENAVGSDEIIADMQFSYRDTDDQQQYKTANLLWDQRRWEQFVTLGLGSGGDASWTESAVMYQGKELYPWPGRKAWKEDLAFLQTTDVGLIEPGTGNAKNRGTGVYDNPTLGNIQAVTMESGYRQIE